MEIKYKFNTRLLIFLLVGAMMSCTSYLMLVYHPFHIIIKKVGTISPGSIFFKLWETPPYSIFIDAFIFNVTNTEAFLAGKEKLKFTEVGPYVYQEKIIHTEAVFNENGTLSFKPKRYLSFVPELSVGPPEDRIITPNIPLLGITAALQDAGILKNLAIAGITRTLNAQPFLNLTINEYLYGYDDMLVTLANKAIPSWIDFGRFGILERMMALDNATENEVTLNLHPEYDTASHILTEKERSAKYHIQRFNGSPGLKHWGYVDTNETLESNTRCNMVEGAFDGTLFPSRMDENSTVKLYRRAFCRPVPFEFVKKTVTKEGLDGTVFKVKENFLDTKEENPDNVCYCKGKCLRKGMGSLAPCYYDIPIAISLPHFLNGDPFLVEQVEGMHPDAEKHSSNFTVHSDLGIALDATLMIQINLDVGQTRMNSITRPFNGLVLPLFWLKLHLGEIPGALKLLLVMLYHVLPIIEQILIYLLGLGGLALMSGSALYSLFSTKEIQNGRLSFRGNYTPIPIIPMNSPYFKPELRILK